MKSALDKFMPKRLLHIRQENLLSQQQMADLLNVSKPYYNRLENGTRAISDLQIKIIAHTTVHEIPLTFQKVTN